MLGFLLSIVLLQVNPTGVVTGVVSGEKGIPAARIRVYAMAVQETNGANNATVLESISQTDDAGRYRLEGPPGRTTLPRVRSRQQFK